MSEASISFWDKRWAEAVTPAEGSWEGDGAALEIEGRCIRDHLKKTTGPILDLGCGAGTLFDGGTAGRDLEWMARKRGYLGIDGSPEAIRQAQERIRGPMIYFECEDLELGLADEFKQSTVVVSRRTLQNLEPGKRAGLLEKIATFRSGAILEGSLLGLNYTNALREVMKLEPLKEPAFNRFLTEGEFAVLMAIPGAKRGWPLGNYYAVSRGIFNKRNMTEVRDVCAEAPEPGVPMGIISSVVW